MSGETARTDADELARLIAIVGQRHWSRGEEHDATDVAEAIAELAEREIERLTAELADEKAFHAKTADNFVEAAAGWSEERERLTRERDAAVRRAETDGRTCVKMGTRNREMMGERDEARRELHERQRECALSRARDGRQRFGADKAIEARAREIAEAAGWSCYSAEGEQP